MSAEDGKSPADEIPHGTRIALIVSVSTIAGILFLMAITNSIYKHYRIRQMRAAGTYDV